MTENTNLNEVRKEWPGWATRHKVGVIVMAVVIIGLSIGKPFATPKAPMPYPPIGHPYVAPKVDVKVDFDRKPFPAEESCAIFEFSKELPGSVCDAATIAAGRP